jgi:hypothetical protein
MAARRLPLRRAALLVSGAFAVHQLRFVLGFGDGAGKVLSEAGHEYLPFAGAAAAVLVLLATSEFCRSLACAAAPEPRSARLRRLWIENAVALMAIYVAQEGLEGAFTPGHPIWAHGGWTVVPLAIAAGGLAALLLVGADRALAAVAGRAARGAPEDWATGSAPWRVVSAVLVPIDVVARHLAGRAPPPVGIASS